MDPRASLVLALVASTGCAATAPIAEAPGPRPSPVSTDDSNARPLPAVERRSPHDGQPLIIIRPAPGEVPPAQAVPEDIATLAGSRAM